MSSYDEFGRPIHDGDSTENTEYHYKSQDIPSDDISSPETGSSYSENQSSQKYSQPSQNYTNANQYSGASYDNAYAHRGYEGGSAKQPYQSQYRYAPPPPPPPKKNGSALKIVVLIAIIVAALAVGGLITYAVLSASSAPAAQPSSTPTQSAASPEAPSSEAPSPLPSIGGNSPTITDTSNPVPDIAESVSPSVVGVTTYVEVSPQQQQYPGQPNQQQGETEKVRYSRGTGFIISSDGYIMTNRHVVEEGSSLEVTLPDGTVYDAKLVGLDSTLDVAVLKVDATGLKAVSIGDSSAVKAGEMCIAIGNPSGVGENLVNSITVGYVSAVNRDVMFNGATQQFIQTDAAINPGNSGGPLLNINGEVIGIVTLKSLVSSYDSYGNAVDTEGIGFAIPISKAMSAAEDIIQYGSVKKPGIGIYYRALTDQEKYMLGIESGILISDFMDGSTAQQAGVQVNDVITKVNGTDITDVTILSDAVTSAGIGSKLTLTVLRGGKPVEIEVTVGDMNSMSTSNKTE